MRKKFFYALRIVVFLLVGFLLLWLVLRHQDLHEVSSILKRADLKWAVLSLIAAVLSNVFRSWRWIMLIRPLGFQPKFANVFGGLMIGYLANLAGLRLGEISRCAVLRQYENIPVSKSFGTVVAERVVDMICIFILLFVVLMFEFGKLSGFANENIFNPMGRKIQQLLSQGTLFYVILFLIAAALIGIIYAALRWLRDSRHFERVRNIVRGFRDGLRSIGSLHHKGWFVFHTMMIWFMYFVMTYVCFFSFSETSGLGMMAGLSVMVMGGFGFVAPVPGGLGAFEFMVTGTLLTFGMDMTTGNAFSLYLHALQVLGIMLLSAISFIMLPLHNIKKRP